MAPVPAGDGGEIASPDKVTTPNEADAEADPASARRLWGPAVPTEMLRDEAVAVWQNQLPAVDAEAKRLVGLLLGGHRIGSRL
jgi:hypothetical protein